MCPGALLYGISPIEEGIEVAGGYRPAVHAIKSRIIHIATPKKPSRVGLAPIGLADGYLPQLPESDGHVLSSGRRVRITGVSMEYVPIDLSDEPDIKLRDEVVLLGQGGEQEIRLDDIARWQGSAPHAVLLAFEGRLRARYV